MRGAARLAPYFANAAVVGNRILSKFRTKNAIPLAGEAIKNDKILYIKELISLPIEHELCRKNQPYT